MFIIYLTRLVLNYSIKEAHISWRNLRSRKPTVAHFNQRIRYRPTAALHCFMITDVQHGQSPYTINLGSNLGVKILFVSIKPMSFKGLALAIVYIAYTH
jgi:hypothetical protein